MKTLLLLFVSGAVLAGCGQKGALYMPDKNASVVTRPATQPAPAPQSQDQNKDKGDDDSASKPKN